MLVPRVEAGGIVALADLTTIVERTALMGTASWLDVLVLAPGIHLHQKSAQLANDGGELPPTASIRTDYTFRIENQAMVGWLQSVGEPGHLVDVFVEEFKGNPLFASGPYGTVAYLLAPIVTIAAIILMGVKREWWTLGILFVLIFARLVNVIIIKRRAKKGWTGAKEDHPDDLLILLSHDRWIRMHGMNYDIKVVTSGQWLKDMTPEQSFASAGATLLVYLTAALSANATTLGNTVLMVVLFLGVGLLGYSNKYVGGIYMYGRVAKALSPPKRYERRLDMVNEIILETGKRNWALGLGMLPHNHPPRQPSERSVTPPKPE